MDFHHLPNEIMGVSIVLWIVLAVVWAIILIALIRLLTKKSADKSSGGMGFMAPEVKDYLAGQPSPSWQEYRSGSDAPPPPPPETPKLPNYKQAGPKTFSVAAFMIVVVLVMVCILVVFRSHQAREHEARMAQRAALKQSEKERKADIAGNRANAKKPPRAHKEKTVDQKALELTKHGTLAFRESDYDQAEKDFRQALSLIQKSESLASRALIGAYNNLAFALEKQDREDEAELYFLMALKEAEDRNKPDDLGVAHAKQGLIRIQIRQGRLDNVEAMYDDAIRIWDVQRGEGNGNSISLMLDKVRFLDSIGKSGEAAELLEKARAFRKMHDPPPKPVYDDDGSQVVNLSIALKFKPVRPSSKGPNGAWIPGTDSLSPIRPEGVIKEPDYQGIERRYGAMELGVPRFTYYFALDRSSGPHPVIYFDKNHNGDLSDDGPPILNQGTGFFAAAVSIPFSTIHERYKGKESFNIWFYMRENDWDGAASHYSQTQLRGSVTIQDQTYTAYLTDTRINDGDFTNDGIYLDIDEDGKIDSETEHIGFGQTLDLGGQSYRFLITP
ncbi:TPR repeat-containing protein [Desulfatibacillum aliphaticivorans]|uniref:TPR repeat-containing protein n=1 Tax=Desulfatibacillum aliphaticivorans TaxID=218208 RepID=B8FLT6_DESAL|nr:tetratricopeptide repeat protein [Desulfatibacillum aliphaticivorans]ACL05440.1 TPR repeat-containing protein [Desulfatibacillum aliphaticivorans]